jgi:tetratricopeptide (TPR) repeat protein
MNALRHNYGMVARARPIREFVVAMSLSLSLSLSMSMIVPASPGYCQDRQAPAGEAPAAAIGPGVDHKEFAGIAKLIDEGSLLAARSRVEALLARAPQDWRAALLAGRLYRKMGLSVFAILQYEKVRSQDPRMVEALVALSQLHLENLSTEIAIMLARQAVQIDPHSKEARLALVEALVAGQSLRQAEEQAKELASMYPADAEVAHTLSGVAQAFGHYNEATALLITALATRPQNLTWRLELADLYQTQGQYGACRTALHQVLEVEPYSLDALNKLAHLEEFDLHEYMPALHSYRAIKDIIGESAAAQAGIDRCLAKQGDLALNVRNAIYRLLGASIRDARVGESNDLPSAF